MDFTWVKRKDCKVLFQDSTLVVEDKYQNGAFKIIILTQKPELFYKQVSHFLDQFLL